MEYAKVRTEEEIIRQFKDGQKIAVGGQTGHSMPERLLNCLLESGVRHLTVYSLDCGAEHQGLGRLINSGMVETVVSTHIGTNWRASDLMAAGKLKVKYIPMGTFVEKLRCGGMGIGGILTETGLGTPVEDESQIIEADGKRFIVETAIRTDISLTHSRRADPMGNLAFRGSTGRANHPIVATCGDLSIVEVDHFCDLGEMGPEEIELSGIFVDMLLI